MVRKRWGSESSPGEDRHADVLIVEPDPDEAASFVGVLEDSDRTDEVHVVSDGDEALEFVHRRGEYADAPRPDLVLLEHDLPGTSGDELLIELKEQSPVRRVPVLVLTDSTAADDVAGTYRRQANAYVQKPDDPDEIADLAEAIEEFWLRLVRLPPKD